MELQAGDCPQSMDGEGWRDWWKAAKSAHNTIKSHKLVSRTAGVLDQLGLRHAKKIQQLAQKHGYGTSDNPLSGLQSEYMCDKFKPLTAMDLTGMGLILAGDQQNGEGITHAGQGVTLAGQGGDQMLGEGFFDWVKHAAESVGHWVADHKVISKGLNALGSVSPAAAPCWAIAIPANDPITTDPSGFIPPFIGVSKIGNLNGVGASTSSVCCVALIQGSLHV